MHKMILFLMVLFIGSDLNAQASVPILKAGLSTHHFKNSDPHHFYLKLKKGDVALIHFIKKKNDISIVALDPDNHFLEQSNTAEVADFIIFHATKKGKYQCIVHPYSPSELGKYEMKIEIFSLNKSDKLSQINELLTYFYPDDLPGASIAILENGTPTYQQNFGLASIEYEIKNTADTRYDLASVSKQFMAYSIALLASKGQLNLKDDIRKHLPELPKYAQTITVKHLISHTSGLPGDEHALDLSGLDDDESYISEEMMMRIIQRQDKLLFTPGSQWAYSNVGYFLLSKIVEQITGYKYSEWAKANIFEPAGMHNTFVRDNVNAVFKNKASSYVRWTNEKVHKISPINFSSPGACCIRTSIHDMVAWVQFLENKKLSNNYIESVMAAQDTLNNGTPHDYSFGLFNTTHHGQKRLSHLGLTGGFRTSFAYFPEMKTAFIHLSNNGEWYNYYIARKVYELYLRDELQSEYSKYIPDLPPEKPTVINSDSVFDMSTINATNYTGVYYASDVMSSYEVKLRNDSLFAENAFYGPIYLHPQSATLFTTEESFMENVLFVSDADGLIIGFKASDDEDNLPITFEKVKNGNRFTKSRFSSHEISREAQRLNQYFIQIDSLKLYPGFGVSVFDEEQIFFQKGYGFSDIEDQQPYSRNTVQIIASISKTFTAVALMQLIEASKIKLDDPINNYLPFKVSNPHFPDEEITIRHLATHTSTIDDPVAFKECYIFQKPLQREKWPAAWHTILEKYDQNKWIPLGDLLSKVCDINSPQFDAKMYLEHPIGTYQEYSNLGISLLGYIIELVSKEDFRAYCTNHILKPLGMDNSTWYLKDVNTKQASKVYLENWHVAPDYEIISSPDGGLYTSIADLTLFLQDIIAGLNGKGKLLSAGSYDLMTKQQNLTFNTGYAIGWDLEFPCCIGHAGNDFGAATLMFIDRKSGIGRILFTNISCETDELYDKHMQMFGEMFQFGFGK